MSRKEEEVLGYTLMEKHNKRFIAARGYTTQRKYAKWFILEDAEAKQRIAADSGIELIIEPVKEKEA